MKMTTREELIAYEKKCGTDSAINVLLLLSPNWYDGDYDEMMNELENRAEEEYDEEETKMVWYAVQEEKTDAWDNGSSDYNEAVKMLLEQGNGLIAVIEDDFCVEEITYDEAKAEADEMDRLQAEYEAECEIIAEQCAEEGYPSHGSNYELRVEALRECYPELFE